MFQFIFRNKWVTFPLAQKKEKKKRLSSFTLTLAGVVLSLQSVADVEHF